MIETTASRAFRSGGWGLFVFEAGTGAMPDTWAHWVHDEAPKWANELVRIVRAARAWGHMDDDNDPALYDNRARFCRDAYTALGNLARACDLPIPSFGPYAWRFHQRDNGPLPWVQMWGDSSMVGEGGEADPRSGFYGNGVGQWRTGAEMLVAQVESHVRDAANTSQNLLHRLGLSVDGQLRDNTRASAPLPSRTVMNPFDASQTELLDSDAQGWACVRPGVRGAWACVSWQVYWPGAGEAQRTVYLSTVTPLQWHWEMIAAVADDVLAFGTVGALIESCRAYVTVKNLAEIRAAGVEMPEDIVTLLSRIDISRHDPAAVDADLGPLGDLSAAIRSIGADTGATGRLIATVVAAIVDLPGLLIQLVGRAVGEFADGWGRREPLLEEPNLTGVIEGEHRVAPTHSVASAPNWPMGDVTLGAGESAADARRRRTRARGVRTPGLRGVHNQVALDNFFIANPPPPPPTPEQPPAAPGGVGPAAIGIGALLAWLVWG